MTFASFRAAKYGVTTRTRDNCLSVREHRCYLETPFTLYIHKVRLRMWNQSLKFALSFLFFRIDRATMFTFTKRFSLLSRTLTNLPKQYAQAVSIKKITSTSAFEDATIIRKRAFDHGTFERRCIISFQTVFEKRSFHFSSILGDDILDVVGPPFPESISEGDIRWIKQKGDYVEVDELIAEIETDKTSVEVRAPQSGIIVEILIPDGEKVIAKQLLSRLDVSAPAPAGKASSVPQPPPPPPTAATTPTVAAQPTERTTITPTPTPPSPPPPPLKTFVPSGVEATQQQQRTDIVGTRTEHRVKMNRMRSRIGQRLRDAVNTFVMLTTFNEVDMSVLMEMRKRHNEQFQKKHGVKLGLMSPFVKAATYALIEQPIVNAVIDENEIVYRHFVDISVAVASERGLVVPVIRNVESMSYAEVEKAIAQYAKLARENRLAIEDMAGGTFTISNGGVFGSLFSTPIINPPQSAILGLHAINDKPVVVDGKIEIRPMMYIALTYDHRLIDGREAVTFLRKIKLAIEDPTIMLLNL
ncbi:Dihydrolipoyllysine-residue succinyltransferase component of 2-oxoglutarate dehydrogenase complex, mitochondrial [Trichinella pseudospiralis]|uniref:Dihydrolipoyllysine-residue succinyltransferase component of 2-oxoglutarate dehydrogenase complex, mitochondrial n=1 Tax=Trichinella pseudospiralis TaxID=6337 RepID=A0A0V1E7U5_TRIPS|nr:Dihydrolipoyllysine-residue succinyltransferase component of 2-oxoglutarate dehydrogenase complex, mitochondrial [Trichinella pseudospiralis]